jgi:magnesium chelatase family protein
VKLGAGARVNADAEGALLDEIATPDAAGKGHAAAAAERFRLTARGYHRVLRLARTIADLDHVETVSTPHIAEALGYRLIGTPEL